MFIQLQPARGADDLTIQDDSVATGYSVLAPIDWGNAAWDNAFSGQRGTQGAKRASSVPKNRPLVFPARIHGSSKTDASTKASVLAETVRDLQRYGGRVKVRSRDLSHSVYYEVFAAQVEEREWGNRQEASAIVDYLLSFDCAPYLLGDPFDINDTFDSDSESDYTFDAGSAADVAIVAGKLTASANLTTEKRMCHTGTGYTHADAQATIKTAPGPTIAGYKAGVELNRVDDDNYVEAYIDDNGTDSRLRIDVVTAGAAQNRYSSNLTSRIVDATACWVRGRIEGNTVYAEYFTSEPTPMSTPTKETSYSLAGAEITNFGSAVEGREGLAWIPQHASAYIEELRILPFTYRNKTLPEKIALYGSLPGDADALADVDVTTSGGAAAPVWALLAHAQRKTASGALNPFGILTAEAASLTGGWSTATDANARDDGADGGTTKIVDTGATSAETYKAAWSLDPNALVDDPDMPGEMRLEIWARVEMSSTVVTPRLIASLAPASASVGAKTYTAEYGSAGKVLTTPSSSTCFRWVRAGTITLPRTTAGTAGTYPAMTLEIEAVLGPGTSGSFGLDYAVSVPIKHRACLESGVPNDSSFGKFARVTTEVTKTIRSDLAGLVAVPPAGATFDNGLGGELLELAPGDNDLLVKLSSLVPDDPTSDATTEQLAHSATIHMAITPRWHFRRDV